MKTITIVLTDLPKGAGVAVITDADSPCIGQPRTPAQSLAMDLLRTCRAQANKVQHNTPCTNQVKQLLNDMLHPEELGHAVTPEVRDRARLCLGMPAVESHLISRNRSRS
ncbi:hypothetical protein SAMN05216344_10698 [Polaromonas sp. OV174]|uniref:hypothetical protein n=1 Tax=Polaromonas sp. OV174 TaxID=1855300 RepID=UPI0008E12E1B|nr:hypothetical protein [Polaromonas sp. OV174]SFB96077.1 hypothetical protein SAMN05216344_10698 [Polaromonas sp. OV174]